MMQALSLPGTVAYRHSTEAPPSPLPAVEPRKPVLKDWAPVLPAPKREEPVRRPAPVQVAPAARPVAHQTGSPLGDVRARANAGDYAAADDLCRCALAAEPLSAPLHFYHGLIQQGLRRATEAETSFLNSIYLDKTFAMAHYHLGLLLLAGGRSGPGRRALTNAARIAATVPDDRALDESDGLTATDLRNLVRLHLDAAARSERKG
jgi:chemotaxis protein methyltransferase CheR